MKKGGRNIHIAEKIEGYAIVRLGNGLCTNSDNLLKHVKHVSILPVMTGYNL